MTRAIAKWVRSRSRQRKHAQRRRPLIEPMEMRRLLTIAGLGFDVDGLGNPTFPGQNVSNAYANLGITITTNNPAHPPTIFDSDNPTGNFGDIDDDLGAPNQDFGGPGVGAGGEQGAPGENSQVQGHILILQEDVGLLPDDNGTGGILGFNFADPVDISDISIMDVDATDQYCEIRLFNSANVKTHTFNAALLGDNSFQTIVIGVSGVSRLEVASPGSFGIPSINFGGEHAEGRMTGGGSTFLLAGDIGGAAGTRITHGFELHCAHPPELVNNRLEVNWHQGPANRFHLLTLTEVTCTEDPAIIQAPPDAPIDTMIGFGNGRFSGSFGGQSYDKVAATIAFTFVDAGEPGVNDTADYLITVLDGDKDGVANDPVVVLDTKGAEYKLDHGNHQAHDELKNLTDAALLLRSQINTTLNSFEDARLTGTKLRQKVDSLLGQFLQFETALTDTGTGTGGGGTGGGGGGKGGGKPSSSTSMLASEDEAAAALA